MTSAPTAPVQHRYPASVGSQDVPHVIVPSAQQVFGLLGSMQAPPQHEAVLAFDGAVQLVPPVHVCVPRSHVPPPQSVHEGPQ